MKSPDEPTGKRFHDGTHRVRSPEETWAWVSGRLEAAGITRVADVTALDVLGIPVWQAVRPASRNLSVSQGKGATPAAARVSAAMESIELWHAEDLGHLPRIDLSLREMRSGNAIPLSSLRWVSGGRIADGIPIPWVRFGSLTRERHGWLPRSMVELDFRVPGGIELRPFNMSSNGLASGNCREEALLHGLCEMIERHALWLAHREPARRVAVDPASVDDPGCREILERLRGEGMKVALWDVTWEVGLPTFLTDFAAPDLPNAWRGSGCHPSPAVALSRALTEAAQSRLTYISGARDDIRPFPEDPPAWQVFEEFAEPRAERSFAGLPDLSTPTVAGDLDRAIEALDRLGYEPFWADLTRPEPDVPVTVVFVPGLRELPH